MSNRPYPVAILAGGMASRLLPLTAVVPKSMLMFNDEPFIGHQLRLLHKQGISRVVICIGHMGGLIRNYVGTGKGYGIGVLYSEDGLQPLGTAGAVKKALRLLGEKFFVLYGDSYLTCNFADVQRHYEHEKCLGLMTVYHSKNSSGRDNVKCANGKVVEYGNRMWHVDYGLSIFDKQVFKLLLPNQGDMGVIYRQLALNAELTAYEIHERYHEIGSLKGIYDLRKELQK